LYRSHSPELIEIYLEMLSRSDLKALAHIQNPVRSRKFFSTLGRGIQKALQKKDVLISHLGKVENPDLVAQIADFLLTYKDANWSVCTGRFKGKLHVSLRTSKGNVQAGEILRDAFESRGQAGGHDAIAGGSVRLGENAPEPVWADMENLIIVRLLKRLRVSSKGDFAYPFNKEL
jgi:nanoRNase/pAp phosphatase (c-di-AMP/oligoRNAs hydrolase)